MKSRTIAISLSAMLLATLLVPVAVSSPIQAQSQTSWYVNDNPTLFGPQQFWFHGASGHGYGTNNYRYTYATGGDPSPNNWARWNMGSRVGQQEIQVYVPSNHATATVNYNVTIGGSTSKVRVAQNGTRGWHSLGNWNTNGANVVIAVYDNDAEHHHERNGLASSSIGVDAIRMRRSDLPPPEDPDPPQPPRDLRLQVVAESDGSSTVVATWSPPSSDGGSAITGYKVTFSRPGRTFDTVDRSASSRRSTINRARANTTYTVRVRAENRIGLSSTVSASVRTPVPPGPGADPPRPPRDLRLQVVAESNGSRTVVATWSPPSSDGGSAITGYKVTFSRPGRTFDTVDRSASSGRSTINRARANTTYTVRVRAENRIGLSRSVSASIRTPTDKFEIQTKRCGLFWRNTCKYVVALRDFTTVHNHRIDKGDWGGEVANESNLSQSGRSWILDGAKVLDDAIVSGNAVVGGKAEVKGSAKIYGDAYVYGDARVEGTADISASVQINGGKISSGTFDGITEYVEAFKEIHHAVYGKLYTKLKSCKSNPAKTSDSVNNQVKSFIGLANTPSAQLTEAFLILCIQISVLGGTIQAVLPSWTSILPYGLGHLNTLRELSEVARDLNAYEQLRKMVQHIQTLYHDIFNNELCSTACKGMLKQAVNVTWR